MFDIGLQEMLVIGVLALLVFGPSKLPERSRMVGRALRELRRASENFRSTLETNLHIDDADSRPNVVTANVARTAVSGDVTTWSLAPAPEAASSSSALFGAKRLPELARSLGSSMSDTRRALTSGTPVVQGSP